VCRSYCRYTTLGVQKVGLLFTTPELRRLSVAWESLSKAYDKVQDAIVSQALDVARTYAHIMQVRRDAAGLRYPAS
jgi:hypothetical protein